MQRYFIFFSYNGAAYHGWQIQPNAHTVQAELSHALNTLLNSKVELVGAGRTDTGVHASEMIAHFETDKAIDLTQLVYQLNGVLPKDIAVAAIKLVNQDAHARFSAESRTYQYFLHNKKNPFKHNTSMFYPYELDLDLMNSACKLLLGKKDFSSFSKSNTQTFTNNCKVMLAKWEQKESEFIFTIQADRFLRNMVRAIVGTMLEVGRGKVDLLEVKNIIDSKDRQKAGPSVDAQGLFLKRITYPSNIYI